MQTIKSLLVAVAIIGATVQSAIPEAQAQSGSTPTMKSDASMSMADGEIRKVDKGAGRLTIKHGEIKHLEMPPMTMVFQVRDKAMLDKVQKGDKVKFAVIEDGGKMVVTELQMAQ